MYCYLYQEPLYFLFSQDVPSLLYYAHIPANIVALLVSFYIFINNKSSPIGKLLLSLSFLISAWTVSNLILWTNVHTDLMIFVWSFLGLIMGVISVLSIYLMFVFIENREPSARMKTVFLLILAPLIILLPTKFNLTGYNITSCDAFNFEWEPYKIYSGLVKIISFSWILFFLFKKFIKDRSNFTKPMLLMGIGIEFFLFSFFTTEFIASYLTKLGIFEDSSLETYGLFGVSIFMVFITFLVVRYHTFNVKLLGAQAMVWALVILVGSQFFFYKDVSPVVILLTGFTLVVTSILGLVLVRSIKKEIAQNEELAIANDNQQLLIRFITHQVKGFFTKSKMVFASILEGDFGEVAEPLKNLVKEGMESDNKAVDMVQEVLNASSLRSGKMSFNFTDLNVTELVSEIAAQYKEAAELKKLEYRLNISKDQLVISADKMHLTQVLKNLIDNSVKYTLTGYVEVGLNAQKDNTVMFYVKDSGVGLTEKDKSVLFKEGGRGEESLRVNVNSTGYGLFIVKKLVEGHGGKIWAESDGRDKGSTFHVQLPLKQSSQKN